MAFQADDHRLLDVLDVLDEGGLGGIRIAVAKRPEQNLMPPDEPFFFCRIGCGPGQRIDEPQDRAHRGPHPMENRVPGDLEDCFVERDVLDGGLRPVPCLNGPTHRLDDLLERLDLGVDNRATKNPRLGTRMTSPEPSRYVSASRTGVRLIPSWALMALSFRRSPGERVLS
jgi:hypothetical protein